MARVLCLDSEKVTLNGLRKRGHDVVVGSMGYRTGQRVLTVPPHEVDIIIWDLKKPACFDMAGWGTVNDNFGCTIVDSPTPEILAFRKRGAFTLPGHQFIPRYQIIKESQLPKCPAGTFGPPEILRAAGRGGVPILLFLNPEWIQHVESRSPNIVNFYWTFKRTLATKVDILSPLKDILPELGNSIKLRLPLKFCIESGPEWYHPPLELPDIVEPVVSNVVGEVFGQIIHYGNGTIWALPTSEKHNLPLIGTLLSRLEKVLYLKQPLYQIPEEVKRKNAQTQSVNPRDVFISHAFEDKDFARPLAEALTREGLTVWFDEYELTLGDNLRQKIEEGLKSSRYGVTILSHRFFKKKWPQRELDGLFELETGGKKILPVWHDISIDEIRGYSPILAGRMGISTSEDLEKVVNEILRAIRRDE